MGVVEVIVAVFSQNAGVCWVQVLQKVNEILCHTQPEILCSLQADGK